MFSVHVGAVRLIRRLRWPNDAIAHTDLMFGSQVSRRLAGA